MVGLQENGRFGGGAGSMPITRPPASIALPGRSITQFTVFPVALAAPPTIDERAEKTPRRGAGVTGGAAGGWAGLATTGPTGAVAAAGTAGVTGATYSGASMPTAGAGGRPGGGAGA
jgi:hypothetical protein